MIIVQGSLVIEVYLYICFSVVRCVFQVKQWTFKDNCIATPNPLTNSVFLEPYGFRIFAVTFILIMSNLGCCLWSYFIVARLCCSLGTLDQRLHRFQWYKFSIFNICTRICCVHKTPNVADQRLTLVLKTEADGNILLLLHFWNCGTWKFVSRGQFVTSMKCWTGFGLSLNDTLVQADNHWLQVYNN